MKGQVISDFDSSQRELILALFKLSFSRNNNGHYFSLVDKNLEYFLRGALQKFFHKPLG